MYRGIGLGRRKVVCQALRTSLKINALVGSPSRFLYRNDRAVLSAFETWRVRNTLSLFSCIVTSGIPLERKNDFRGRHSQ